MSMIAERVAGRSTRGAWRGSPVRVAIVCRKGGSGKTTTAFHLGGACVQQGWRVLLVDLDPQASLTRRLLPARPRPLGIWEALLNPERWQAELVRPTPAGFDLVPGDALLDRPDYQAYLPSEDDVVARLHQLLTTVAVTYDVILIDTPPRLALPQRAALLVSDLCLVVTQVSGPLDLDPMAETLAQRQALAQQGLPVAELVAIVPSNVNVKEANQRSTLERLYVQYAGLVAEAVPHSPRVARGLTLRTPISASAPDSTAAQAFMALSSRLLGGAVEERNGDADV